MGNWAEEHWELGIGNWALRIGPKSIGNWAEEHWELGIGDSLFLLPSSFFLLPSSLFLLPSVIKQLKTRFLQEEIGLLKPMVKRDLLSKLFGK